MKFIVNIREQENCSSLFDSFANVTIWFDHYVLGKSSIMFYTLDEQLIAMLMLEGNTFEYHYCKEEK